MLDCLFGRICKKPTIRLLRSDDRVRGKIARFHRFAAASKFSMGTSQDLILGRFSFRRLLLWTDWIVVLG
jgi:hypothetical protein